MINKRNSLAAIIIFVLLCVLLLGGCAHKPTAAESTANAAHQTIAAIKATLPAECKTDAINAQLNSADALVDNIVSTCAIEKAAITAEKLRWQWAFFALVIVLAGFAGRSLARRL